jgi:4-diphosphocytidyl-2-C-methyl-D-erythritol kinase
MRVTVVAPAKINLDLRVLHRRPDGFHELRTLFQEIALHDTVTAISHRGACEVRGDAAVMPLDATNLAWRAAQALWSAAGRPGGARGARLVIAKRIPAQTGLGGGSSDAAAALVALNRLWGLRLPPSALMEVAGTLGADVPFFLVGGSALGLGRGERLYPLVDLPSWPVVLVLPAAGVPTASAYRWLAEARQSGPVPILTAQNDSLGTGPDLTRRNADLGTGPDWRNDLEDVVAGRHPDIAAARRDLERTGAWCARMSGSGSAVFGLFRSDADARRAAAVLRRRGRRVLLTKTRPRGVRAAARLRRLLPG